MTLYAKGIFIAFSLSFLTCQAVQAQSYTKDPEQFIHKYLRTVAGTDTAAAAVVLYEKGSSTVYTTHREIRNERIIRSVIKVHTSEGAADMGNVVITTINVGGRNVEVKKIKGTVYNLEGNKVVKQELGDATIFRGKLTRYVDQVKFSLPNVRPGSIIEYSYIIDEPLSYNIDSWTFDGAYPKLHSEFEVSAPKGLVLSKITQNTPYFVPLASPDKITESQQPNAYYTQTEGYAFGEASYVQRWVRKKVPAMHPEPYVSCADNYKEHVDVQITEVRIGSMSFVKDCLNTYEKVNERLYESFHFYQPLIHVHTAVSDKVKELTAGLESPEAKARAIFHFVRTTISTPERSYVFYTNSNPDEVLKEQQGSRADANMLLIGMLKKAGLDAEPVLVSTGDHIRPLPEFPLMDRYNMVVCLLTMNGRQYFLDASDKYQPFGVMSRDCYNGYARMIAVKGAPLRIEPEAYQRRKKVFVRSEVSESGAYKLRISQSYDYDNAMRLRGEWTKDSSTVRKYASALAENCFVPARVESYEVKNLGNADTVLGLDIVLNLDWPSDDRIYLTPQFINSLAENPLKAAQRQYPVELEGCSDEAYFLMLRLPEGLDIEELPQSEKVILDDKDSYQYLINYDAASRTVSVNSRLQMNKTVFQPAEYEPLRSLFDKMLLAQKKTIVLKKAGK